MSENEVETGQEGGGTVATEEAPKKAKLPARAKEAKKMNTDEIIAVIKNMTVLELADLVKTLETEFGVTAAAPVAVVGAAPVAVAAPAEEKTEFNVILKEFGANKISVIRAVRELTSLGLKESKDLVEGAPKPVKEKIKKEEAAEIKAKLEAEGASIEIK